VRERPLQFGDSGGMLGLVTEPERAAAGRPAVLILNSGLVHRIGTFRNSVKIARRLATDGFPAVRFDLSGVGDSEPRRDAVRFEERWLGDVRAAMDHVERTRGVRWFVLMGLCSGADNAFRAACRDERVAGVVLMDWYTYPTLRFRFLRQWARIRQLRSWRRGAARLFRSAARRLRGPAGLAAATQEAPAPYVREFPPRDEVAADLRVLVARGVHLCVIYSGGMLDAYNYREQLLDAFPDVDFQGRLNLEYLPDADHIYTELASQRALVEAIARWTGRCFGTAPAPAPATR
jgi:pimeloyl-ACP methyl ester carboxylesterase